MATTIDDQIDSVYSEVRDLLKTIAADTSGSSVFSTAELFASEDATLLTAIQNQDEASQTVATVMSVLRATFDAALAFLQAGDNRSVTVILPSGSIWIDDEILSDDFQEKWWEQTTLSKKKHLIVTGDPAGGSQIRVKSTWGSACRNATNGNERAYGPWNGSPSPSCVFCTMADTTLDAPAAFSIRHVKIVGQDNEGKDPVAWLSSGELDAKNRDIHVTNLANYGEIIMGSFNSSRISNHFEGCGLQPVKGGSILGNSAGFPPPWVKFDISGSTLSAIAGADYGGYTAGDAVPFFKTAHEENILLVHNAASHSGIGQTAQLTISAVASDGIDTATFTLPSDVSLLTSVITNRPGSYLPLEVTTIAGSTTVTLSDALLVGSGAADMVGQIISIPKAGSTADTDNELFVSRISAVGAGDDTNGYTTLTMASAPTNAVTDLFIYGVAHFAAVEETLGVYGAYSFNDTDLIQCRWEGSGGYQEDNSTGAIQFVCQGVTESVQYIGCKVHGSNPVRGHFGAEGNAIVDNCKGVSFIGVDFTHMSHTGKGVCRFTGANSLVNFSACSFGSWQQSHNWCALYIDPKTGFAENSWSVSEVNSIVKNDQFPLYDQSFISGSSSLKLIDIIRLSPNRLNRGIEVHDLTSADDLDDFDISGFYKWGKSENTPSNAPMSGYYSVLEVKVSANEIYQETKDIENNWTMERFYTGGVWGGWRLRDRRYEGSGTFSDIGSTLNTDGKFLGALHHNLTDGKLYMALGDANVDDWQAVDGSGIITPI